MMFRFSAMSYLPFTKPAVFRILSIMVLLALFSTARSAMAQMPGQERPGLAPVAAQQSEHGFHATVGSEVLDVTVCGASVIHVVAKPDAAAQAGQKPWMLDATQSCAGAPFQFAQNAKSATLKTDKLEVTFGLERGNLSFRAANGDALLREGNSLPRTYEPVQLNGESTYRVTDRFSPTPTEAVYGLGQHQSGCSTIAAQPSSWARTTPMSRFLCWSQAKAMR